MKRSEVCWISKMRARERVQMCAAGVSIAAQGSLGPQEHDPDRQGPHSHQDMRMPQESRPSLNCRQELLVTTAWSYYSAQGFCSPVHLLLCSSLPTWVRTDFQVPPSLLWFSHELSLFSGQFHISLPAPSVIVSSKTLPGLCQSFSQR